MRNKILILSLVLLITIPIIYAQETTIIRVNGTYPSNQDFSNYTCKDSDSGKSYYIKGNTLSNAYFDGTLWPSEEVINYYDGCCIDCLTGVDEDGPNSRLKEFYCEDNIARSIIYSCPNGCKNGACLPKVEYLDDKIQTCADSDGIGIKGINYFYKGSTKGVFKDKQGDFEDYCQDESRVVEFYCASSNSLEISSAVQYCDNGCKDGMCLRDKERGFFVAYVACYDGYDEGISDNTYCRTASEWKSYTENICEKRCNTDNTKCGVNTLKLSTECSKETNQPLPTSTGTQMVIESQTSIETTEEVTVPIQESITLDKENKINCGSCLITEKDKEICIPFGTRYQGQFCDITQTLIKQKELEEQCENSYECLNNECSSGKCISTYSLLEKILNWLTNIFK